MAARRQSGSAAVHTGEFVDHLIKELMLEINGSQISHPEDLGLSDTD
jgi:hypothetical protein